jgi:hypothetical protein
VKKVKRSFSALDQFLNCERQFFFRRVAGLPEPPSHYLAIGCLYHEALAVLLNEGEVDLEEVLELQKLEKGWTCPTADAELLAELRCNLERVERQVLPYIKQTAVEVWSNEINDRAKYCAKLDVLSAWTPVVDDGQIVGKNEVPCVLDWKTVFSARKHRSQEDVDTSPQLALYCLEAGVNNAGFVEVPRDVHQDIRVVVTSFTDAELRRWDGWFQEQFGAIETRGPNKDAYRLAAPGNKLCSERWCPCWGRCMGAL